VLLGDDGFGPLAVEIFRCRYECSSELEVLDLGTPGLDLAPYLYGIDLVIIADAVKADANPGTVCIYSENDVTAGRGQLRLTAHDPGLKECIAQLKMAGHAPSELIIVGVVAESCSLGDSFSASVHAAVPGAVEAIASVLAERGIRCSRRQTPQEPNLWWVTDDRPEFRVQCSKSNAKSTSIRNSELEREISRRGS
jgi:hydrogenase maturation protease